MLKRAKKPEHYFRYSICHSAICRFSFQICARRRRHLFFAKSANDFPNYETQSKRAKFPSTDLKTGTKALYTCTDRLSNVGTIHTLGTYYKEFSNCLQPLKIVKITLMAAESALNCSPRTALNTELAVISTDFKTVGFFLKTSKEIGKA